MVFYRSLNLVVIALFAIGVGIWGGEVSAVLDALYEAE